jgi:hypothetical protein
MVYSTSFTLTASALYFHSKKIIQAGITVLICLLGAIHSLNDPHINDGVDLPNTEQFFF